MNVSSTRISTYLECRRKYRLSYIENIWPRKRPIYFVVGSAVHKFLEHWYTGLPTQGVVAGVFNEVNRGLLSPEEIHNLTVQQAIAEGIVEAYPKFYARDRAQYKKFVTEKEADIKLSNGHKYYGKVDMLAQDAAGDWWIFETKTAAQIDANYIERAKIDWQNHGYMHLARKILGCWPKGVVYNMIKKPGIRLKKGETVTAFTRRVRDEYTKYGQTKHYFMREPIYIGKKSLDLWYKEADMLATEIGDLDASSVFPRNTGACTNKWGVCSYLMLCATRKVNPVIYQKGGRQ